MKLIIAGPKHFDNITPDFIMGTTRVYNIRINDIKRIFF
jgi:hypothetical protein